MEKPRPASLLNTAATVLLFLFVVYGQLFAQSENTVVAIVNGKTITQREVDSAAFSQIFPLQEQIHAVRKVVLENLILQTLLDEAARERGISIDELRKRLTIGKVEVSTTDVEREYMENAAAFGAMSPDEAKERIRLSIESQERIKLYKEALRDLRKRSQIEIHLDEPRSPLPLKLENSPGIGSVNAPVLIVEFANFQCPFCRESTGVLKRILERHKPDVALFFKHLPLDVHNQGFNASRAAFCAGQQGSFWRYHDELFAVGELSMEALNRVASGLGLDIPKFNECTRSEISRVAILNDMTQAKLLGINSTPVFVVNGRLIRGSMTVDQFESIIENELKIASRSPTNVNTPRKD